jgi:hypothetical protein
MKNRHLPFTAFKAESEKSRGRVTIDSDVTLLMLLRRHINELITPRMFDEAFGVALTLLFNSDDTGDQIKAMPSTKAQAVERWLMRCVAMIADSWPADILGTFDASEPWCSLSANGGRRYLPLRTAYMLLELYSIPESDQKCRELFERAGVPVPKREVINELSKRGEGMDRRDFVERLINS